VISSTGNLRLRRFILAGMMIATTFSLLFMGVGGGAGTGADPRSTAQCMVGNFMTNVTETTGGPLIVQCSSVGWTQLTGFPSPCSANQFVTAVGASLTCSAVAWTGLTSFPTACSSGKFVTGVGITLTCASPPTAAAKNETRFSVTYPYTSLTNGKVSQDVTSYTLPKNHNFTVWFASGNETGVGNSGNVTFISTTVGALVIGGTVPMTTAQVTVSTLAGRMILVTGQGEQQCQIVGCVLASLTISSVTDTGGNTYTQRSSAPTIPGAGTGTKTANDVWSTIALATLPSDIITVHYVIAPNAAQEFLRAIASQYNNVGGFGASNSVGGITPPLSAPYTASNTITSTPGTPSVMFNSLLGLDGIGGFGTNINYTFPASQTLRGASCSTHCTSASQIDGLIDDKPTTGTTTSSFTVTCQQPPGGSPCNVQALFFSYSALELLPGNAIYLQIVDTTHAASGAGIVLYQLDVTIAPFYQGNPQAASPLTRYILATDAVLTFRVNGGGLTTTITGVIICSIMP
jgi:hypothetical protein